jgi:sugar phosphate isomerase/epimerase
MSTPARHFGVQSYCFRNYKTNLEVAQKVRKIGLDRVEVCGVHADFNDQKGWQEAIRTYQDEGVEIISIGVQTFHGEDRERDWFQAAAAAGAKHISAHFGLPTYQTAIPKVQEWCREFGVRVGIHCHGGYMFGGSPDVLEHLIKLGTPEIGLWIDTAWAMQIGPHQGNPVAWVEKFAGKIYGVHYKDFVFESNAQWRDVVVGEGTLNLPAFVEALDKHGFDGVAVIEYEGDVENPVPALTRCVEAMRRVI